jgi:hypothetical protein
MMGPISRTVTKLADRQVTRLVGGAGRPAAVAMAMALPYVARALGPSGMVALAVGGWVVGRMIERQAEKRDGVNDE